MLYKFIKIIVDDEANVHATGWTDRGMLEVNTDDYLYSYARRIEGVEYRIWCNHVLNAQQVDYFIHIVVNEPTWIRVNLAAGDDGC